MEQMIVQPIDAADRSKISDIYIPLDIIEGRNEVRGNLKDAYCFCGGPKGKLLAPTRDSELLRWVVDIYAKVEDELKKADNFRIEYEGVRFRVHRQRTVTGDQLALRALPKETPHLSELNMIRPWRTILMDPALLDGGLVLVAATNGQGKTTTISSTLRSRLEQYGGLANTIEDPPELPLHGWFGEGRCNQIPVHTRSGGEPGSGFAEALINTRRFFPALTGGGSIQMIGEIRDSATAAETLQAASEGHLVLTTYHGSSVTHALRRLWSAASERLGDSNAKELLGATLRVCIHQRLTLSQEGEQWERGKLSGEILCVTDGHEQLHSALRDFDAKKIREITRQQTRSMMQLNEKTAEDSRVEMGSIRQALNPAG
jgi:Tfp pilus assembly pilus retraction ATPase PilT